MSLLRGVQRLALGLCVGVAAAAAAGLLLRDLRSGIHDDIISGGIQDAPGREKDPDAIELARFAVAEHNSKTNAALELVRLVKVRTQIVGGLMHYFTVEAREVHGGGAGAYKLYEAKVWLREWENLKGLHSFEPADQGKTMI